MVSERLPFPRFAQGAQMNQLKTVLLLGVLSALLVGLGGAVAPGYTWVFLAVAVAMNVASYFFSDRIVLAMHRARELGPGDLPRLHAMVEELAARAGLPKPRLFFIDEPYANAFATGRNPRHGVVAVTRGIVDLLDERELRGVLAHELAHVRNRDILVASVAATIAAAVTHIGHALSFTALLGGGHRDEGEEGGSAAGGLLFAFVAPVAATLVQLGISRSREYLADETGARISGDPLALASALEKLHRGAELLPSTQPEPATASLFLVSPLTGVGGLLKLFSTHPPPEERVRRLRAMAGAVRPPPFGAAELRPEPRNRLVR
jgi:heat shock protein HtpX